MEDERALALISTAQLASGIAGMAVAVRRRHPYDTPFMSGNEDSVARDSITNGTALWAPVYMLAIQALSIDLLARRGSRAAARSLGVLGGAMTCGYLIERLARERLRPGGWEPTESPIAATGILTAGAMVVLSRRCARG